MRITTFWYGVLTIALLLIPAARSDAQVALALSDSTVTLNGPWKFHTGDEPDWSHPAFDDSGWESVDLTAPPGANDGDVGLAGYVPGWTAKGHPGYQGYAWYRIRLTVIAPTGKTLALLGPWAVDSVYQVYVDGRLLGGVGDFSASTPTAYGNHYPKLFVLPSPEAHGGAIVIAIRVWMGPWALRPGNGGIHIAPAIGEREAISAEYRLQWLQIFEGYAVDAVPALLFVLLAVLVLCLVPGDRTAYSWLAAALVLSAIQRGNQAFFFWWQLETVQGFVYIILALVASLSLGAWLMAWRSWFKADKPAWLPRVVAVLTVILILAQLLSRPWLFHGWVPHLVAITARYLITCARLGFLLALAWIVYAGVRRNGREAWLRRAGGAGHWRGPLRLGACCRTRTRHLVPVGSWTIAERVRFGGIRCVAVRTARASYVGRYDGSLTPDSRSHSVTSAFWARRSRAIGFGSRSFW